MKHCIEYRFGGVVEQYYAREGNFAHYRFGDAPRPQFCWLTWLLKNRALWATAVVLLALCASTAMAYTTDTVTYAPATQYICAGTDATLQTDVENAIAAASTGDVVLIPAGTHVFGASSNTININKAITVRGVSRADTVIQLSTTGPTTSSGVFQLNATGAVLRALTILAPATGNKTTPISTGSASGWRITNVKYDGTGQFSYFVYFGRSWGLIDSCDVVGGGGTNELIFGRGPTDMWSYASSTFRGTANAVYVEDCNFSGVGYVCDANAAAVMVVRYNTASAILKIDGHGLASNSLPTRGVRFMEIYGNNFTATTGSGYIVELRGGGGIIFNNVAYAANYRLTDYGVTGLWSNFGDQYQTPYDYPVHDQIGTGPSANDWSDQVGGAEPVLFFKNLKNGAKAPLSWVSIPSGAIDRYRAQTGNPSATFTMQDIIQENRDWFDEKTSFNGTAGGIGIGTKAQMLAITPTTDCYFWVTDEADWNALSGGNDGQMYHWSGSAWVLYYTPYPYPHPMRSADGDTSPPTPSPATFISVDTVSGGTSLLLRATVGGDVSEPVYYRYSSVPTGNATSWSEWTTSSTYLATGKTPLTAYDNRVQMRDALGNSGTESAITTKTTSAADPRTQRTLRSIRGGRF